MTMARRIAAAVHEAGGRTYYVGGYVRDRLLGRDNKDIDIEIHGLSVQSLERILDSLGERITMGASFGVMGLRHYELDVAMPRSEVATGRGHKDFAVFVDPFIGEEKAACRRDFTINALMQDVLTDEVLDFFDGREDMARRLIRHVNDRTFAEDPLRVYRAAQFAARFGFSVADHTAALSASMDVSALPGERVMAELEKALLKADRPSVFFSELRRMRQLSVWFPEAEALIGLPREERFHPEGDGFAHTMRVLDEAARLREDTAHPLWFMLSALCHGFGNAPALHPADGSQCVCGREEQGRSPALAFLDRLTNEVKLKQYVLNMTELYAEPDRLVREDSDVLAYMRLFDRSVCPEELLLLAKAEHMGRVGGETGRASVAEAYAETENRLRGMLSVYHDRMNRPYVMGRDLLEAGMTPGPLFSQALAYAHELRLAGRSGEEQLRLTLDWMREKTEPSNAEGVHDE